MTPDILTHTQKGSLNLKNEDYLTIKELQPGTFALVLSDGMGGKDAGGDASHIVSESIIQFLEKNCDRDNYETLLYDAFLNADLELKDFNIRNRLKSGATVAAAICSEHNISYCWQGNVRIYLYNEPDIRLITNDHVLPIGYGQSRVTRCIKGEGLRDDLTVKCLRVQNYSILICSDGLYNHFEENKPPHTASLKGVISNLCPEDDASFILLNYRG